MTRASLGVPAAVLLAVTGCLGSEQVYEENGWGIGAAPDCDPSGERCWPDADRLSLTSALGGLEEVMAEPASLRTEALRSVVARASELSHKMTDEESLALYDVQTRLDQWSIVASDQAVAETATAIHNALYRLKSGMISAHMVPAEQSVEAIANQDPCDGASVGCAGEVALPISIPEHYSPGTRAALADIASSSVFGKVLATMLITNGALDMDYEVENARLFGEYDEQTGHIYDSGLSPAARVQRIISRAEQLAGWAGAVAGGESLIPMAGIAISIGHEEWMLFEIHSKMVFRIAQVYGWDVKDGPALINVVMLIMTDGFALEATDILLSNIAVPLIARRLGARFGYHTADQIVQNLTSSLGRRILAMVSAKARRRLTREVVQKGAKAVAKQIFGWITFGATVAISAGADYYFTGVLGRRVANTAKRWLGDFLRDGSTFLARDEARECAFGLYGRVIAADGRVDDLERRLYQGYMAKEYYVSETLKWGLARSEQVAHAARLRTIFDSRADQAFGSRVDSCLETSFVEADEEHRMALLAFVYAMMHIDGDETWQERAVYADYRARLKGPMFRRLDDDLMGQIERTVVAEIRVPQADVAAEYGIDLRDMIPALTPPEAAIEAYREGRGP